MDRSALKTLLHDLKERELSVPLVGMVVAAVAFLILVDFLLLGGILEKLNAQNTQLEHDVGRYVDLKQNEDENIKLIDQLKGQLEELFQKTEKIYAKDQFVFDEHLKGLQGIGERLKKMTKMGDEFQYDARTEGAPIKLATMLQYKAKIGIRGSMDDVMRLMAELEKKDGILIEVREISIDFHHVSEQGTVLQAYFSVSAYQRREATTVAPTKDKTKVKALETKEGGDRPLL